MSQDKEDPKPNKPPLKMQIKDRTVEAEPITYSVQLSEPSSEFKAVKKNKV